MERNSPIKEIKFTGQDGIFIDGYILLEDGKKLEWNYDLRDTEGGFWQRVEITKPNKDGEYVYFTKEEEKEEEHYGDALYKALEDNNYYGCSCISIIEV